MIRATDLVVRFGKTTALSLPKFALDAGERLGVVGTNGSGKSTLMRVLAGLQRPSSGTITGLPRPGRIVLVHQHPTMFRGSGADNVIYALARAGRPRSEAAACLALVDASHLAERVAGVLSVGEKRRIAVARALATQPDVLLLDEPIAGLDERGTETLLAALNQFDGALVIAAPDVSGLPVDRTITLSAASGA